ncbi:Uncharacterised protein [uncultured archaeon]|nr:Uncharacterised protein [uncultured archaeon]
MKNIQIQPQTEKVLNNSNFLYLKRSLDEAVKAYEVAIMRNPTNQDEIKRCVDRCVSARNLFNLENNK